MLMRTAGLLLVATVCLQACNKSEEGSSTTQAAESTANSSPAATATPDTAATHEVFDTYLDPKGETYLALRTEPSPKEGETVARMPDGTRLIVESRGHGRNGVWWKVRVVSGEYKDAVGFAHSKWVRGLPGAADENFGATAAGPKDSSIRITPVHLRGLSVERLKALCDQTDGEACIEVALHYLKGPDLGLPTASDGIPTAFAGQDKKILAGMGYLAAGCRHRCGQACALMGDSENARKYLLLECSQGRDDSCEILATTMLEFDRTSRKALLREVVKFCQQGERWACVLRIKMNREFGGPQARPPTACGTDRAVEMAVEKYGFIERSPLAVPEWNRWSCMSKPEAGQQWKHCLRRKDYSDRPRDGCPGRQRCCPPANVDLDNFAE